MPSSDVDSIGWCHECWAPTLDDSVNEHRDTHVAASSD